ncbi:hypothetical protein BBOV_III006030 [Babesia bovis T2Bo]|uniref:Nucleoporin NSP1-like C-terminal domain-containing protein n=1 Tax=Babesia bovis TaxID=5865 RepID=A7ANN0_BABBO|nr:hypothetical protein BBOV_III006030 [Babesia bovis T2Bo]EDO08164.1 hypothetical protein BBOV_III006030 [Babesia bovis T2Bo]|eukprot:XP_001611732.1 hypothetical protein [Babesia bovis T2Bo]
MQGTGTNLFGSSNFFGDANKSGTQGSSPFTNLNTGSNTTGLFGTGSTLAQNNTTGSATTNVFGTSTTPATGNLFGTPSTTSNVQPAASTTSTTNVIPPMFGTPTALSKVEGNNSTPTGGTTATTVATNTTPANTTVEKVAGGNPATFTGTSNLFGAPVSTGNNNASTSANALFGTNAASSSSTATTTTIGNSTSKTDSNTSIFASSTASKSGTTKDDAKACFDMEYSITEQQGIVELLDSWDSRLSKKIKSYQELAEKVAGVDRNILLHSNNLNKLLTEYNSLAEKFKKMDSEIKHLEEEQLSAINTLDSMERSLKSKLEGRRGRSTSYQTVQNITKQLQNLQEQFSHAYKDAENTAAVCQPEPLYTVAKVLTYHDASLSSLETQCLELENCIKKLVNSKLS